jgi:hypothetical protein
MPTGLEILASILNGKQPIFEAAGDGRIVKIYVDGRVEGLDSDLKIVNWIKPVVMTLQSHANQKSMSANFPTATVIEDLSGRSQGCAE